MSKIETEYEKRKAHFAFYICVFLSITIPALWGLFVSFTPTEYNLGTITLIIFIGFILTSPFILKAYSLNRVRRSTTFWLEKGDKYQLTGLVESKSRFNTITVASINVFAWGLKRELEIGDKIMVEYLPVRHLSIQTDQVLRINNRNNPYFESPWLYGPPT